MLFIERVDVFLKQVERWVSPHALKTKREEVSITERGFGTYLVDSLVIETIRGEKIAGLIPVGGVIIGAQGRIDLKGNYDRVIILFLDKDGPTLKIKEGDSLAKSSRFFKGIEEPGWYWIEDKLRAKAHLVNKKLFLELLEGVSDHEIK